jgi:hypothetical protein
VPSIESCSFALPTDAFEITCLMRADESARVRSGSDADRSHELTREATRQEKESGEDVGCHLT